MLASMAGFFLSMIVLFLLMLFLLSGLIMSVSSDKDVVIKNNSVLEIRLDKPIKERAGKNPFGKIDFGSLSAEKELGLDDILKSIDKASGDDRIRGIFLNLTSVQAGIASMKEVRDALIKFKTTSHKFIYAYSESYTQGSYYLASIADSIWMHPEGDIDFRGLGAGLMFLKGTMDKLEIEPEIIRHGKFKSAVEPFLYDKMSPENREQTSTFLHSIWNNLLEDISKSRNISVSELQSIADELKARDPEEALKLKMVDRLVYYDEVLATLKTKTGKTQKQNITSVELGKYIKSVVKVDTYTASKIAVIYASGDIVSGDGNDDQIGSSSLAAAIRKARTDTSIKAIVLRVNSPGGSALASDVIWRETKLAKATKPLIVSMGDYAASGGYYISCLADTIVAQANTITGSIGVFGLMFNAQKMLKNKLGITFDTVKTGKHGDFPALYRPMSSDETAMLQKDVERVYDTFLSHVAEGRKMDKAQVDSIGQGRVWSGTDAKRLGLVDVIGGINDAIRLASIKANLRTYRIVTLPEQKEFLDKVFEDLNSEASVYFAKRQLGVGYTYFEGIQSLLQEQGVIARLPFIFEIR